MCMCGDGTAGGSIKLCTTRSAVLTCCNHCLLWNAEASEVMQQQQLHAAAAAAAAAAGGAAAEYGGPRPPALETAISAGSVGSPLAGGKSPLGPGSRTVRCVAGVGGAAFQVVAGLRLGGGGEN